MLPRGKLREINGRNEIKNCLKIKARITIIAPRLDPSPSRGGDVISITVISQEQLGTSQRTATCHEPLSYPIPSRLPQRQEGPGSLNNTIPLSQDIFET